MKQLLTIRNTVLLITVLAGTLMIAFTSCESNSTQIPGTTVRNLDTASLIKRGDYLVTIGGCDDCHSPKNLGANGMEIDIPKRLSGFPSDRPIPQFDSTLPQKGIAQFNGDLTAAAGPWGISFASNITSDATGIGNWRFENFRYAMRHGTWKGLEGGRPLLPPMPWYNFSKMTDEDIKAIYTFLQHTAPVKNVAPEPRQFAK